jgi:hypothetical protein
MFRTQLLAQRLADDCALVVALFWLGASRFVADACFPFDAAIGGTGGVRCRLVSLGHEQILVRDAWEAAS